MKLRTSARITAIAVSACLCGCSTTGDPRQGGLFGWNETKAQARQAQMQQEANAAEEAVTSERQRAATLQSNQATVTQETARAQQQRDQLLTENQQLDDQLRSLMQQRRLSTVELQRLQELLSNNKKVLQAVRDNPLQTAVPPDGVSEQNRRLQREILDLLQR
jgi:septal ring factor EnvC (AmiA/AmiB activator)